MRAGTVAARRPLGVDMARIHELRDKLGALDSEMCVLHARDDADAPGVRERWDRTVRQRDTVAAELDVPEQRAAKIDDIRTGLENGTVRMVDGIPDSISLTERASANDTIASALRALNRSTQCRRVPPTHKRN
jgi:hypothetical protein